MQKEYVPGDTSHIRVLAFTCCGHCPAAIVKLHGKMKPMDVYCPFQPDGEGYFKVVYQTFMIDKLHPDCPLPTLNQLNEGLRTTKKDKVEYVDYCNRVRGVVSYGQGKNTKRDLDEAMPNRRRLKKTLG